MSISHDCMEEEVKALTRKEQYQLDNNINSKVLVLAFSLSAEIERELISQRTKEASARRKEIRAPKVSLSKKTKLTGKEDQIQELLSKNIS